MKATSLDRQIRDTRAALTLALNAFFAGKPVPKARFDQLTARLATLRRQQP